MDCRLGNGLGGCGGEGGVVRFSEGGKGGPFDFICWGRIEVGRGGEVQGIRVVGRVFGSGVAEG